MIIMSRLSLKITTKLIEQSQLICENHFYDSVAVGPCIANGGSPFWFTGYPRITGAILTGPHCHLYHYYGMTSKKSMSDIGDVRHRVDSPSTKDSSKDNATLSFLLHTFFSLILALLFIQQASLQQAGKFKYYV